MDLRERDSFISGIPLSVAFILNLKPRRMSKTETKSLKTNLKLNSRLQPCTGNSENSGISQAPVVEKVDSAIRWINLYPLDNAIGFPNIYPLDI